MLICFHATGEAKEALDNIMATGHFRDMSEAISIALLNYGVLTKTVSESGEVFPSGAALKAEVESAARRGQSVDQTGRSSLHTSVANGAREIPETFRLRITTLDGINLQKAPATSPEKKSISPAQWLFGQFNRFLPTKATCRALLNLLIDNPAGIPVAEASNKISHAACILGDYLQRLDQQLQAKREDAFSAAFPISATAEGGGESRLRFSNQFVAHLRQSQLGGFPAALRLITMGTLRDRLSLTRAGAEFALLMNPVLDGANRPPNRKLSETEVEFLLHHIIKSVPEEKSAFTSIFEAIESGAKTPDTVDKFLRQRFSLPTEKAITSTFLSTQRTGAISRMSDLGLLGRKKEGLRVQYFITDPGSSFHVQMKREKTTA